MHRYSLPELRLLQRWQLSYAAEFIALNSTGERLALITKHHVLKFFDIRDQQPIVVPNFERRDVWSLIWDAERANTCVCMEKQKVIVLHGVQSEKNKTKNIFLSSIK